MKTLLLLFLGAFAGICAYAVIDKPIIHTVESAAPDGKRRRLTINILIGAGNTINYNQKDES